MRGGPWGSGFRVEALGLRGSGFKVEGLELRAEGLGDNRANLVDVDTELGETKHAAASIEKQHCNSRPLCTLVRSTSSTVND